MSAHVGLRKVLLSRFFLFPEHYDETYFQGLKSEAMTEEVFHGERRIVFKKNIDVRNEFLDARCYAIGAAEIAGLARTSEKDWNNIRRELGLLQPLREAGEKLARKSKKNLFDNL